MATASDAVDFVAGAATGKQNQEAFAMRDEARACTGIPVLHRSAELLLLRRLTFELSGGRRCDDWPARLMIGVAASRARRHAVGSPLERGVRQHPRLVQLAV
jgi:hypothetical protein